MRTKKARKKKRAQGVMSQDVSKRWEESKRPGLKEKMRWRADIVE